GEFRLPAESPHARYRRLSTGTGRAHLGAAACRAHINLRGDGDGEGSLNAQLESGIHSIQAFTAFFSTDFWLFLSSSETRNASSSACSELSRGSQCVW